MAQFNHYRPTDDPCTTNKETLSKPNVPSSVYCKLYRINNDELPWRKIDSARIFSIWENVACTMCSPIDLRAHRPLCLSHECQVGGGSIFRPRGPSCPCLPRELFLFRTNLGHDKKTSAIKRSHGMHYDHGQGIPASTRRWPSAGIIMVHRRRRWPNIKTALGQRHVFNEVLSQPTLNVSKVHS